MTQFLAKTIGGKPIVDIKLNSKETTALIDTGSQVSMISEKFFNDMGLCEKDLQHADGWFQINGANGLEIPYIGLLITDVIVQGYKVPDAGILVVRDSPGGIEMRKDVPGLLGTNVLQQLPQYKAILASTQEIKSPVSNVVRVSGCEVQVIPAGSVGFVPVRVSGCSTQELMYVEPLTLGYESSVFIV